MTTFLLLLFFLLASLETPASLAAAEASGKSWSDKIRALSPEGETGSESEPSRTGAFPSGWFKHPKPATEDPGEVENPAQEGTAPEGAAPEEPEESAPEVEASGEPETQEPPSPTPLEELRLKNPGDWAPFIEMGEQFFPSYLLSTAVLKGDPNAPPEPRIIGDRYSMAGVAIINPGKNTKVRLELKENLLMESARLDAVLEKEGETYFLCPTISFKFDVLKNQRQPVPINLNFSLSINGAESVTRPKTGLIRSINDCPTSFNNFTDSNAQDISYMYAAYVNESHPMIDVILKEALATRIVKGFTGYQNEDADEVYNQVFAIWTALQKRGIKYSSITTPSAHSDAVFSQNVRFIEESLKNAQANCVDGSVLFASILYKIGITPFLVVVPAHMYLGFYLDEKNEYFACLETTVLSEGKGRKHFDQMLKDTLEEFNQNEKKFLKDDDPEYQIIDIDEARKIGILPIAFTGRFRGRPHPDP